MASRYASNKINTAYDNKRDFTRSLSYKMFNTEKSMYIKSLKLQNFRNYAEESFAFDPAVNLICGENGQGKTNLLEAAAACSTMRLFRTAQKKRGCGSERIMPLSLLILSRRSAISRLNCGFPAQKRWKSIKTVCGRNASQTHRDCSKPYCSARRT